MADGTPIPEPHTLSELRADPDVAAEAEQRR